MSFRIHVDLRVACAVLWSTSIHSHSLSRSDDCRCLASESLPHWPTVGQITGSLHCLFYRLAICSIDLSLAIAWAVVACPDPPNKHRYVCSQHSLLSFHMKWSSVISQVNFTSPSCEVVRWLICKWAASILESFHSNESNCSFFRDLVLHVSIYEVIYGKHPSSHLSLCALVVQGIQVVDTTREIMKRMVENFVHLVSVISCSTIWWCYSLRIHWHRREQDLGSFADLLSAYRPVMWALLLSEDFGNRTRCLVCLSLWWLSRPTL